MQILNVRFGLATNSSSTHSLAFLPEGIQAHDYMGYREGIMGDAGRLNDMGDFGWQHFTLASPEAKLRYLGVLLRNRLCHILPSNVYDLIIKSWVGTEVGDDDHIDHQSEMFLPSALGSNPPIPDERFVKDLRDYLLQERLVILGGNDNETLKHPLHEHGGFELPLPRDCGYRGRYTCRYDEEYKFWVLFNQEDGTKLRFRFDAAPDQMTNVPVRASLPELVDIKITNRCPYGCNYCYQSSEPQGQDSDQYLARWIADELAALEVFEVSLGGGEPTLHSEFLDILEAYKAKGIVANFTTRNLNWLRDPGRAKDIVNACGAFAYSVHHYTEVKDFVTLLDYNRVPHEKAVIQVVLGTFDMWRLREILDIAGKEHIRTTLLGFKEVGRGANAPHSDYSRWIDIVKENHAGGVSIDTALAAEFKEQILAAGIPEWMFTTKEGAFSCYLDLVEKKVGPSSFCKPEEMRSFEAQGDWGTTDYLPRAEVIRRAFREFTVTGNQASDLPQPDSILPNHA